MSSNNHKYEAILAKLLAAKGHKPGKKVKLHESDYQLLIQDSLKIIETQPMLLELSSPIKVMGDIHG